MFFKFDLRCFVLPGEVGKLRKAVNEGVNDADENTKSESSLKTRMRGNVCLLWLGDFYFVFYFSIFYLFFLIFAITGFMMIAC